MRDISHPIQQENVMVYLDGELSIDEATKAAAHLEECLECRQLAAELRSVSQGLSAWQIADLDVQMNVALEEALVQREQKAGSDSGLSKRGWREWLRFRRWPTFALGAASAGLVMLLVVAAFFTMGGPSHMENRTIPAHRMTMADSEVKEPQSKTIQSLMQQNQESARRAFAAPAPPMSEQQRADIAALRRRYELEANLANTNSNLEPDAQPNADEGVPSEPMIARSADVTLIAPDFDKARGALDAIVKRHGGYLGQLSVTSAAGEQRKLSATIRVPASQLDAALADIKGLGRVDAESQSGEEVTAQYVDLEARLNNARNTEKRLTDLLRQQTGKLGDVLSVETEISRVRGEIERMEAERKELSGRVSYATVNATISENYKANLQVVPPTIGTQFRNAAVAGYQGVVNGVVDILLFLMSWGPSLVLWGALLFFPGRFLWRKFRRREAV
jgi:hypothetical protein